MLQEVYSDPAIMLRYSGIEVEAALGYALEKNREPQITIE
jgi:hypothetical protein